MIESTALADGRGRAHRRKPAGLERYRRRSPRTVPSAIATTWSSAARPRPTGTARRSSPPPACRPRWAASPACSKATPDEATPLQRELDRTGKLLGLVVVAIAVVMIVTILLVEDVRGIGRAVRRADPGRRAGRRGGARGAARGRDGRPRDRRAAHGAAQRHRPAPGRGGDARLGHRDRVGQDGHADQERDDGAGRRDRERPRRPSTARATRRKARCSDEGGGRSTGRCGSSSSGRSRPPTARTTPSIRQTRRPVDGAGRSDGGRAARGGAQGGLSAEALDARLPRVGEVPFSSERKLMSTLAPRYPSGRTAGVVFTKGAPDVLLDALHHESWSARSGVPLTPERRAAILETNEALAGAGAAHARRRRTLADDRRAGGACGASRRAGRAGSGLRRADRHDRSAARRGEGRRGARQARRHSSDHDHRRSPAHGRRHRPRARHQRRRTRPSPGRSSRRCRTETLSRTVARGLGLCPGEPRAQAAHRRGAAALTAPSWR